MLAGVNGGGGGLSDDWQKLSEMLEVLTEVVGT